MSDLIIFKKGADKSGLRDSFLPSVLFIVPSELRQGAYIHFLTILFQEFLRELSKKNEDPAERFYFGEVGEEGGIGSIFIDTVWFDYCKIFVFDGEDQNNISDWKGIWMRNHMDMLGQIKPLYELAERFELFLQQRSIPYQRFGHKIDGKGELFQQVTR